jgi:hypothetical protein
MRRTPRPEILRKGKGLAARVDAADTAHALAQSEHQTGRPCVAIDASRN